MRRVWIGLLVVVAALTGFAAPAAAQEATGSIAGIVTDSAGDPLSDVAVFVGVYSDGDGTTVSTGSDGRWHVDGLESSSYLVCFDASSAQGGASKTGYLDMCAGQAVQANGYLGPAKYYTVDEGQSRETDQSLLDAARIIGRVTDDAGEPVPGITVSERVDFATVSARTDQDGRYVLAVDYGRVQGTGPRLLPGVPYRIRFEPSDRPNLVQEYYHDAYAPDGSAILPPKAVTPAAGVETVINEQLDTAGSIGGVVRDGAGTPIGDVDVTLRSHDVAVGTDRTDADGVYRVAGLPAESYTVCFGTSAATGGHSPTGYLSDCNPQPVSLGYAQHRTDVDETLHNAAGIAGTIRDRTGKPIPRVGITIDGPDGNSGPFYSDNEPESIGAYAIGNLQPGTYTICFRPDYQSPGPNLAPQCYKHVALTGKPTPVTLTAGVQTRIDPVLDPRLPAPADFDGDRYSDRAVWRPSTGDWLVLGQWTVRYGLKGDVPVPGDFDNDGRIDRALWRPSTGDWFVQDQQMVSTRVRYGLPGDVPVPGDFDANGTTDRALWRPSTGTWYVQGQAPVSYGLKGDVPVRGDFDGDGVSDRAVWRPSTGTWFARGRPSMVFGAKGDVPVPGDYNGDGRTDHAVWRPSTGDWYVSGQPTVRWGVKGDIPVVGDFDRDGRIDHAVWRPSTGTWYVQGQQPVRLGNNGDIPV